MNTLKAINEWGFQIMFVVGFIAGGVWMVVGLGEALKFAAQSWFKPAKETSTKKAGEGLSGAKE
ncbi:MAG: hypothetical protein JWM16_5242 [Verrucomicrobiales bacterium]|nr:hypothetical protein [Verrucomicrobiales bacterium]